MENIFKSVLGMSAAGSAVILAVLLVRAALRKAPKLFSYVLWGVVLFRLLYPFTLESAISLLPSAELVPAAGYGGQEAQTVQVQTGLPDLDRQVNDFFLRHPYRGTPDRPEYAAAVPSPVTPQTGENPDWRTLPAAVWLAGTAALLGYSVLSVLKLRRTLAEAVPLEGEPGVWLADRIPTPFVLGLLRPRIYLPSALPKQEQDYILLHERTHIRRCDHILRALAWLAAAIHWFNPLVWLAFHLAGKDMEMSCDEAVLRRIGRDVRADYSASLLRLSIGKRFSTGPLAFGDGDPKGRIKNILRYKKPALWVTVTAVIAVTAVCAALATNRAGQSPEAGDAPSTEVWLDYSSVPSSMPWDEYRDTQLPEFPGHTFRWKAASVGEYNPDGDLIPEDAFITGMPVWNVFLCDLNGDGKREFCSTVSYGSGLIDNHVAVYDYANRHRYTLWDRGIYDYALSLEDGQLMVTKSEYIGEDIASGRLILTGDGRLAIEGQEVDSTAALPIHPSYELSGEGTVRVTELSGAYVEWNLYSYVQPFLYFAQDPFFFCPRLTGRMVEGSAMWADSKEPYPTVVEVSFAVNDDRVESGTIDGFSVSFTVDTESGTVTQRSFRSWVEGETLELKDHEMVAAARTFANLLREAEAYYYDANPAPAPEIDLSPAAYALDDLWTKVEVTGLDCYYTWWFPTLFKANYPLPENGQGYLSIYKPRFLGENLSRLYDYVTAIYSPDAPYSLWLSLGGYGGGDDTMGTIDLRSGVYTGSTPLSTEELLSASRALVQLITQSAEQYAVLTDVHEEGPLPFDKPMKLWFGSGAGAWSTILTLHPDGSFEGDYHDADMTIQYVCQFHGRFTDITQVSDTSWSMTLEELVLDTKSPVGREWDGDGYHYISSEPYGFDDKDGKALKPGAKFTFYTPEATGCAPGDDLYGMTDEENAPLREFWSWWPAKHGWGPNGDVLGCYALHNVTSGRGFFDLYAWGIL